MLLFPKLHLIHVITSTNYMYAVVGNKVNDYSEERRQVSTRDAESYAAEYNILYIETCPKTNKGVDDAFCMLTLELHLIARAKRKQVCSFNMLTFCHSVNSDHFLLIL